MTSLNLGCGKDYWEGWKNIDISNQIKTDECYDIEKGLKEPDNSVSEIHCGCVLEQVEDLVRVMNECWRVLEKGGVLRGYVPSTDPRVLHLDPMDKRFFQEDSFKYFVETERAWTHFGRSYGFKPWARSEVSTNENGIIHFSLWK
jgi:hypothetical protein